VGVKHIWQWGGGDGRISRIVGESISINYTVNPLISKRESVHNGVLPFSVVIFSGFSVCRLSHKRYADHYYYVHTCLFFFNSSSLVMLLIVLRKYCIASKISKAQDRLGELLMDSNIIFQI
jgi:hypothetical protein